jgi:hypothetical protein
MCPAGEKGLGVWMPRFADQAAHWTLFDDSPCVHDRNAISDFNGSADIVRDEHDSKAEGLLQLAKQKEDLNLDRRIECGRRFIG